MSAITHRRQADLINEFCSEHNSPLWRQHRQSRLRLLSGEYKEMTGGVLLNRSHSSKWIQVWLKEQSGKRSNASAGQILETWGCFVQWCFRKGVTENNVHCYIKPKSWYGRGQPIPDLTLYVNLQRPIHDYLSIAGEAITWQGVKKEKCALLNFNRFINRKKPPSSQWEAIVSKTSIQNWILSLRDEVTPRTAAEMFGTLARLFAYMKEQNLIAADPAAELIAEYRRCRSRLFQYIMEERSLDELKREPKFISPVAEELEKFCQYKRTFGKYVTIRSHLKPWDRYLATNFPANGRITQKIFSDWVRNYSDGSIRTKRDNIRYTLDFCRYVTRDEFVSFSPYPSLPKITVKPYYPHLFKSSEVKGILEKCDQLTLSGRPVIHEGFRIMYLLGFTTAMRPCEIVRLRLKDFDVEKGVLFIEKTKFNKSRYVPLSDSVARKLKRYLKMRPAKGAKDPQSPLFWNAGRRNHGYAVDSLTRRFKSMVKALGILANNDSGRIRLYDLRHSFCSHRVHQWYREGVDLEVFLPLLSILLGHKNLASTIYYLKRNQLILEEASQRFQNYFNKGVSRP